MHKYYELCTLEQNIVHEIPQKVTIQNIKTNQNFIKYLLIRKQY